MPLARSLGLVLLAGLAACGGDDAPSGPQDVLRCDITEPVCQGAIFASVAEVVDVDEVEVPPVRTISVAQFEQELQRGVNRDDLTGNDARTRGLRLMGFIPESSASATQASIDHRVSAIAAYYDRGNQSITIIDRDYDELAAQSILAHEFLHAIQDREVGIGSVYADVDTTDGVMGARTVIEGDATYVSFAWVYEQLGVELDALDWQRIYEDFQGRLRARAADPELAITSTASSFPYAYGIALLGRVIQADGLPGRAAMFTDPPPSALAGMLGYSAFRENGFTPVNAPDAAFPAPPVGSEPASENRVGAWYFFATLLRLGFDELASWVGATTWRGDQFGIFEDGAEVVAVWRIRLNADPTSVVDAINQSGREVAWSAFSMNNDVFILAAESDALLAVWEAQPVDVLRAELDAVPDLRKRLSTAGPLRCSPPALPDPSSR